MVVKYVHVYFAGFFLTSCVVFGLLYAHLALVRVHLKNHIT